MAGKCSQQAFFDNKQHFCDPFLSEYRPWPRTDLKLVWVTLWSGQDSVENLTSNGAHLSFSSSSPSCMPVYGSDANAMEGGVGGITAPNVARSSGTIHNH